VSPFRDPRARCLTAVCLLACIALAACQPQTNVSATGHVPVQYQHVWVTLQQVEFNTSATAGPEDSAWKQYTLSAPQTVDLAALTNGALGQFASSLKVQQGTYNQMRITLVDANASLASSAKAAGATFNDEVDYTDASGTLHRLPLAVPNAAQGVAFPINLTVASAQQSGIAALACATTSSNGSVANAGALFGGSAGSTTCGFGGQTKADCVSGQFYDSLLGQCITVGATAGLTATATGTTNLGSTSTTSCPAGATFDAVTRTCVSATTTTGGISCAAGTTLDTATGTCVVSSNTNLTSICASNQTYNPTTGTCSTSLSAATTSLAIDFDASRDIAPYLLGGQPGFLLIPRPAGYNLAQAGSIVGSVNLSGLPVGTGGIVVTAETLSSDGSRHVIVKSATLSSTGSFVLYPLPATTSAASSTSYTSATTCPSGETYDSASGTCVTVASATEQFDLVIHGPSIATVIITGVPVTSANPNSATTLSFGVTLAPATAFGVQLASSVSPVGASVGFYQTIPSSGEVPYLIEAYPIDPFTGAFDAARYLSTGDLLYGAYVSGGAVALTSAAPAEGTGSYHIAASAPLYGDGPLSTTVTAPPAATITPFTAAAIPLPSGTSAANISGTVTVAAPGKYDKGELLLTQNGALIAVAPLDSYLGAAQSAAILFSSVPAGSGGTVSNTNQYSTEVWVWSSSNPSGTLSRQPVSSLIDLSSGSASGVTIAIE
jgi:uncharacterized protein DUF4382